MPTRVWRFGPPIAVFMLVKATPGWLGFTVERRNEPARTHPTRLTGATTATSSRHGSGRAFQQEHDT